MIFHNIIKVILLQKINLHVWKENIKKEEGEEEGEEEEEEENVVHLKGVKNNYWQNRIFLWNKFATNVVKFKSWYVNPINNNFASRSLHSSKLTNW